MSAQTLTRSRSHARENARLRAERKRTRSHWVWAAFVVFVIAAATVAFFSARGSTPKTEAGIEQARPVQITGSALPELGSGADNAVGRAIPELTGASFNGTPTSITHDGRAKLVVFVAHWCPHCQAEVPRIVQHLSQRALPTGVDLVAVSTSASPDRPNYPPSEWLAIEDWPAPVIADSAAGEAALAYGLSSFPYFVATDTSGKVVARSTGEISMDQFDALVQKALTGSPG